MDTCVDEKSGRELCHLLDAIDIVKKTPFPPFFSMRI